VPKNELVFCPDHWGDLFGPKLCEPSRHVIWLWCALKNHISRHLLSLTPLTKYQQNTRRRLANSWERLKSNSSWMDASIMFRLKNHIVLSGCNHLAQWTDNQKAQQCCGPKKVSNGRTRSWPANSMCRRRKPCYKALCALLLRRMQKRYQHGFYPQTWTSNNNKVFS